MFFQPSKRWVQNKDMIHSTEVFGLNGSLSAKLELWNFSFLKDDDFAMREMVKHMDI